MNTQAKPHTRTTPRLQNTQNRLNHLAVSGLVAAALALSACSKPAEPTVGQQIDSGIAQAEKAAAEAKASMQDSAKQAQADLAASTDSMTRSVKDLAITASVKTELAKDSGLSALDVNVDTEAGRVLLRGIVPDASASERARALASAVDGVVSVDNQLTTAPK